MPTYRGQVRIPYFTGIPTDVMTNTWHFETAFPAPLAQIATNVTPVLQTFYDAVYAPVGVAAYCNGPGAQVAWYDLTQPEPRVPVFEPMPIARSSNGVGIPTEAAMVLSFQADPEPGIPQARRRGRIFIGGLDNTMISAGSNTAFPTFGVTKRTEVCAAAEALMNELDTLDPIVNWVVRSETNSASYVVSNGWVDDSPDTVRRRSVEASARTTFSD